ncbi:MAG: glycosyl hydrolase [Proteobacteria bacterium]|nr:glycosyl hydrolase [Pseudomonadota bacterium]
MTTATPETGRISLLVGTKKGAFFLRGDPTRQDWSLQGPYMLGHIVNHVVLDPRDRSTLLMAARTGHLGPTVFRSNDEGKTWKEASRPPAFPKLRKELERSDAKPGTAPWQSAGTRRAFEPLPGGGPEAHVEEPPGGRVVDFVHWLTPGHANEPGVWYAGASPQSLFRSEDAGDTWAPVAGFNDHPLWPAWTAAGEDGTPDGSLLHSVLIDPRDPAHLYIGMSGGGVFESPDKGESWAPLNAGSVADFAPDPNPEFGQDPHCVRQHPLAPDVLYQQNHCGIYRMHRPDGRWERIGDNMPREVGDIGFGIALHARDPDTAWVFPMDGTEVWPRTSPDGRPAVYVTRDAGRSWQRQDEGLPREHAWYTVYRQALTADAHDPVGVYFGTTCGEVWASQDEGGSWHCIANHLPIIQSVEVAAWES